MVDGGLRGPEALALVVMVAAAATLVPPAAATATTNEAPMADAGLDRSVSANVTVYLDATGSRDPDGEIVRYEWRIEQPDGSYATPDCRTCARTSFVPRTAGEYNVTVTVTDGTGATSSDTLRVDVGASKGPTVSLAGPETVVVGRPAGYSVSVSAGANDLSAVTWRLDGERLNRTTVDGESAVADHAHIFTSEGTYTLQVTAVDRLGRERSVTKNVTVTEPDAVNRSDGGSSSSSGSGGAGSSSGSSGAGGSSDVECYYPEDSTFSCEADSVTANINGNVTISDSDRDGEVTVNGTTYDVQEGKSITINQSTWQDHYQPSNYETSNNNSASSIHYDPGIEQRPGENSEMINGNVSLPIINNGDSGSQNRDTETGSIWRDTPVEPDSRSDRERSTTTTTGRDDSETAESENPAISSDSKVPERIERQVRNR